MNFWIFILSLGIMLLIVGMFGWMKNYHINRTIKRSSLIMGIFLPMLMASFYAETLINDFFPDLTLIDLGGIYIIGMISGFFSAFYFLNREKVSTN